MERSSLASWRWPFALVAAGALALIGLVAVLRSCSPGALTQVNVTTRFMESLPEISRAQGGLLELAAATATETFTRSDERYTAWGWIYLGATVSEIRVPATFRYHVQLADKWNVEINGRICSVIAPRIRPSLPVAIHTDQLEKKVAASWMRFDGADQLATLERDLTPALNRYAGDKRHIALVREQCRKTVEEFVKGWLLQSEWASDPDRIVKVIFADETPATTPMPAIESRRLP
jgi:hypothetical protein